MDTSQLSFLFSVLLLLSIVLQLWLLTRQMRHVAQHRDRVPAAFAGIVSATAHARAARYQMAKGRVNILSLGFGTLVLLGWTLMGGLGWLNLLLLGAIAPRWGELAYQLALLVSFGVLAAVLELPFDLYQTFRLEQQFGFNRLSFGAWLADALKGAALSLLIGVPVAALMLWLMASSGPRWWLAAWAVLVVFNLLAMVVHPLWISPLFNRFTPLEHGPLRDRIQGLLKRCGFHASDCYVMDGSRRSAHSNAYFTGLGRGKRVVLYDTLLSKLNPSEVEAVLAHELGHFQQRHLPQRLMWMLALSLLGFALLGWLSSRMGFYLALGVRPSLEAPNDALALLLFSLILPVFSIVLKPLFAWMSRRHEFQADAYACRHAERSALISALQKLYEDNASTLTPDPLYVRFHYSHPPASERLAALNQLPIAHEPVPAA